MKYTQKHETCDTRDCVNVGWIIDSNSTRARLTKHSRWQGSRNSVVATCKIDAPLTQETACELAETLDRALACGVLSLRRGDRAWGFTLNSAGYIVR